MEAEVIDAIKIRRVAREAQQRKSVRSDRVATIVVWSIAATGIGVLTFIVGVILWRGLATALTPGFIFGQPQAFKAGGGIWPMVVSSFYLAFLTLIIVLPVGVGAGIYMAEYSKQGLAARSIRFGADSLSTVPSLVFGIVGLSLLAVYLRLSYCLLAGAVVLALLNLPTIMRTAEESLKAVPHTYREASMGLGASRWYTTRKVVLPAAIPGITTGAVLTLGRVIGESAAVVYLVGMYVSRVPLSPLSPGAPMAANIYHLYNEAALLPDAARVASGESAFLLLLVLALMLLARLVSWFFKRKTRVADRFA